MNKLSNHALTIATFLAVFLGLVGCQSAPQTKSAGGNADPQILAEKQKEYDQLLAEWKTLKPGLSRLLAIEGELNLLLGQLEQLSSSLEQSQGPTAIASADSPEITPDPQATPLPLPADAELVTAPISADMPSVPDTNSYAEEAEVTEEESAPPSDSHFALQVASITDMRRLPIVWQEMMDKNRALLADMEPNFERTNVRNTDYYRLKLGGFSTEREASRKCDVLKNAGVDCIVVSYTRSDFAQLSDYTAVPLAAQNLLNIQGN